MNTYEFTVVPQTEITTQVEPDAWSRHVVLASGPNWVDALDSIDPDHMFYVVSSKTLIEGTK